MFIDSQRGYAIAAAEQRTKEVPFDRGFKNNNWTEGIGELE